LKVPDNLAVVGFDDMPLASYFDPPLTTVGQDIFEHGRRGAQVLIETIGNPSRPPERIVVPAHLVVRESSGARTTTPLGSTTPQSPRAAGEMIHTQSPSIP
jgi:DNA-binding LacI/PurR family transcriptional regulator